LGKTEKQRNIWKGLTVWLMEWGVEECFGEKVVLRIFSDDMVNEKKR
jgi:hypothetical protein